MTLSKILDEISNLKGLGYTIQESIEWVSSQFDTSSVEEVRKNLEQEEENS